MAINTANGIDPNLVGGGGLLESAATAQSQPPPGSSQPDPPVPEDDRVRLTPASLTLRQLETSGSDPPIDQARVAALRGAIERGEYRVNPDRVANKLLEFEHALFP